MNIIFTSLRPTAGRRFLLLTMLTGSAIAGHAESVLIADCEEARNVLNWNSPRGMDAVPDFLILGKKDKFYVGAGGQVKVTGSVDIGHPVDNPNEFITAEIPMGPNPGNGANWQFSAQQSQLYLNMVAFPNSKNRVGVMFGITLLGNNYTPEIEYAYLRWRGFQAGYDYNLFSDPAVAPPGVDYEGPNAFTAQETVGVRYYLDFGKKSAWRFEVGAELPCLSLTNVYGQNGQQVTEAVRQRVPDIPLALQYSWAEGSHVRLSGIMRNLYSRNLTAEKNYDRAGWGVQLSMVGEILPGLTGYAQGVYGKGIASYIQDLNGLGMDLMPDGHGGLEAVECWGAYGALQYDFSEKFTVVGSYSHVRTYPSPYKGVSPDEMSYGLQYRYAQYASGTLFYNITSNLQAGLEYIWGRRVDCSGAKSADTRLQASMSFSF